MHTITHDLGAPSSANAFGISLEPSTSASAWAQSQVRIHPPAALFIAFVNPATNCVFHLNGCCRELFGCFKGLNLSVASHQNGAASWTCKCMVRKQVGPCRGQR